MPLTLADLPVSPERKLLAAIVALLRSLPQLTDVFKPIIVVESPTREAFINLAARTMAVQPVQVKESPMPSKRSVDKFGVMISAFLPPEATERSSDLVGLDLGNYLRQQLWGLAVTDPDYPSPISFATTEFRQLTPLVVTGSNIRILSYQATFETDIDPVAGDFSA